MFKRKRKIKTEARVGIVVYEIYCISLHNKAGNGHPSYGANPITNLQHLPNVPVYSHVILEYQGRNMIAVPLLA